ncbi:ArsA family ATPase [Candidatus Poribacteria bacterium]|nr:ArsA family ATPase [Candidatus Poribacteria bacterium]
MAKAHELIKEDMNYYIKSHPSLKYIFWGGKGGVGKTVMAAVTALWLSENGKKTLLVSTNPVHSLSGLLSQNVFGKETKVNDTNLFALEIDTKETIAQKKVEIREKIEWFLRFADISSQKTDDFIETATMNPAFEESAMFERMVDLMFENKYDIYIFDTAPTANARKLLGMSKVYTLWVEKILSSREDATTLRKKLSVSKTDEKDPLMDYLINFRSRIDKVHKMLTDDQLTAFFFATLPEALPIAVIKRFIGWFQDFGIPIGGVVVNGLLDKNMVKDVNHEFILNRINSQSKYMDEIFQSFPNVRAIIPRFENEILGVEKLKQVVNYLF